MKPTHDNDSKFDQLIREKLDEFLVTPPLGVWDRVNADLDQKRQKRRGIILWRSAMAASFTLLMLSMWFIVDNQLKNNNQQSAEKVQIKSSIQAIPNMKSIEADRLTSANKSETVELHSKIGLTTSIHRDNFEPKTEIIKKNLEAQKNLTQHKESHVEGSNDQGQTVAYSLLIPLVAVVDQPNQSYKLILPVDHISLSDRQIIAMNVELLKNNKEELNKNDRTHWAVGAQVSPSYSREFQGKNSLGESDASYSAATTSSSSDYKVNFAGMLLVEYKAKGRLSVQTGVSYAQLEQQAGKIGVDYISSYRYGSNELQASSSFGESYAPNDNNSVALNTSIGVANIALPQGAQIAISSINNTKSIPTSQNFTIDQSLRYIEVPLILRYRLIDKKIGMNILGGVSTNFLFNNTIAVGNGNDVLATGKTEGLRPVTWSSNIGFGLDYAIIRNLYFQLEPTFKLPLSSLNQSNVLANTRPYSFGVFTGVKFTF